MFCVFSRQEVIRAINARPKCWSEVYGARKDGGHEMLEKRQKPDDFGDDNHFVTDQRGYCVILKGIIEDLRNYVS